MSIGVTLFGDAAGEGIDEPLKRADLAMYQAKLAGRNALRFFDPQMQASVRARAELEAGLWSALSRQFCLHFQPQVDGAIRRDLRVEALARWLIPERGLVPPAHFIPLAEENGLIVPLGRWVLQTACAQLAAWARDPATARLSIAVNVSARQFRQATASSMKRSTASRAAAPTPRSWSSSSPRAPWSPTSTPSAARLDALKASGVRLSLDDFGTGYSSLAYLNGSRWTIKIDRDSFVSHLVHPNDAAIAAS